MKKYFFALGSNNDLSLAELTCLFPDNKWQLIGDIAISEFNKNFCPQDLMLNIGGTIKIGEIIKEVSLANRHALSESIKKEAFNTAEKNVSKKLNFGFSFYDKKIPGDFLKLGLAIKKELKKEGISSRIVTSRDLVLSSVIVEQNKLINGGIDFCLIKDKNKIFLGKTLVVQPFKSLSKRDFGRPNRDDHSGMIPPKLAQIMINLARSNNENFIQKTILDPFCGSGTILMESYLMGFRNIVGSDLSENSVFNSIKNINWIIDFKEGKSIETCGKNIDIFQSDVIDLGQVLDQGSIDYIVCEPYLGPQRGFKDFTEVVGELNDLYSRSLDVFNKLLKKDGRIIMVWPQFRAGNKIWKINPKISNLKYLIKRGSLVYGREDQKVWREIIVLIK